MLINGSIIGPSNKSLVFSEVWIFGNEKNGDNTIYGDKNSLVTNRFFFLDMSHHQYLHPSIIQHCSGNVFFPNMKHIYKWFIFHCYVGFERWLLRSPLGSSPPWATWIWTIRHCGVATAFQAGTERLLIHWRKFCKLFQLYRLGIHPHQTTYLHIS